jgi:hypothetical protein
MKIKCLELQDLLAIPYFIEPRCGRKVAEISPFLFRCSQNTEDAIILQLVTPRRDLTAPPTDPIKLFRFRHGFAEICIDRFWIGAERLNFALAAIFS